MERDKEEKVSRQQGVREAWCYTRHCVCTHLSGLLESPTVIHTLAVGDARQRMGVKMAQTEL